MKRSTIFIDEELEADIKHVAKIKGKKVSNIIREALKEYLDKRKSKRNLSFVGIGKSGHKNISDTFEKKLWDKP
ncbi:MAG: CopG family transcriptional regulator [Thermodesulfobacteriota bacterium]